MSTSHAVKRAVQCALAVALTGSAYPVFAQEQGVTGDAEDTGLVEEVIVTGTRIVSPNMTSTSPIQVVSSQEIQQQGRADIADVIAQLPQNFPSTQGQGFSNRTSGLSTAGGVTTADLRGLGPQRTLVLVNGRRCPVLGRVMMNHVIVDVTRACDGDLATAAASLAALALEHGHLELHDRARALAEQQYAAFGRTELSGTPLGMPRRQSPSGRLRLNARRRPEPVGTDAS